jgi:DNA repair protein SbcC/Rad50
MKLISIQLKPFAGISNLTIKFREGLNVICGPNEAGKSTIVQALLITLFTPTNLAPAAQRNAILDYLPMPSGDTIQTKLRFLVKGEEYSIEKSWGGTKSTKLIMPDGSTLTEPATAQLKISELLELNEATFRNILFAEQCELKHSIKTLTENHFVKSSLSDTLRRSIMQQDGVSADVLQANVSKKVEEYFNNWDVTNKGPRDGRGLNNRHKQKVGKVLEIYYAREQAGEALKFAKQYEAEVDAIIEKIRMLSSQVEELTAFTNLHRKAYTDSKERATLEAKRESIDLLYNELNGALLSWPTLENAQTNCEKEIPEIKKDIKDLDKELNDAHQAQQAIFVKQKFADVQQALQELNQAEKLFSESIKVEKHDLVLAEELERQIFDANSKINAQQLSVKIFSKIDNLISLKNGMSEKQEFHLLKNQEKIFEIVGKFQLTTSEIIVCGESKQEDINALENLLNNLTESLNNIFKRYKVIKSNDLSLWYQDTESKRAQVESRKSIFDRLLNGESLETLTEKHKKVLDLPASRAVSVINDRLIKLKSSERELNATLESANKKLTALIEKYVCKNTLQDRLTNELLKRSEIANKIAELEALPPGYENNDDFISSFEFKASSKEALKDQLSAIRIERERLDANKPEKPLKSIIEDHVLYQKVFLKRLAEGQAYLTVRKTLENILETVNERTYLPLQEKVDYYVGKLTAKKYSKLILNGVQPHSLQNHTKVLGLQLLSKGTLDIVALALRLGAADFYLKGIDGFLVMDDPLVDLDPNRQKVAAEILAEFANEKQTIIFTCHDTHAALLKKDYEEMLLA